MNSLAVFGSLQEIRSKLQNEHIPHFSEITIQPPLGFIKNSENPGLFIMSEDLDFLSQEICFISFDTLEKEEMISYLKKAEIDLAPLSNDLDNNTNGFDMNNQDDNIAETIHDDEKDIAEDLESLMFDNLVEAKTLQDALRNRVMIHSQKSIYNAIDKHLQTEDDETGIFIDMNDVPALIEAKNSVLSRLIPPTSGYSSLFLLESEFNPETESMELTLESEMHALNVIRLNFEIEQGVIKGISIDPQGKYILTSSSITTYMIENFAPGIVACTSASPTEEKIQLNAWYSNPDGYDGVFPEIADEWFDAFINLAKETEAIFEGDIPRKEDITFAWSGNIPSSSVPLVPNVLPQEEVDTLYSYVEESIENLIEDYENNDDNDE